MRHTAYLLSLLSRFKISASPHPADAPGVWVYDVFDTVDMSKSSLRWDGNPEDTADIEKHLTHLFELDIPMSLAIARTLRQIEGAAADVKKEDTADGLRQSLASIRMRIAEVAEAIEKHEAK